MTLETHSGTSRIHVSTATEAEMMTQDSQI